MINSMRKITFRKIYCSKTAEKIFILNLQNKKSSVSFKIYRALFLSG